VSVRYRSHVCSKLLIATIPTLTFNGRFPDYGRGESLKLRGGFLLIVKESTLILGLIQCLSCGSCGANGQLANCPQRNQDVDGRKEGLFQRAINLGGLCAGDKRRPGESLGMNEKGRRLFSSARRSGTADKTGVDSAADQTVLTGPFAAMML
jgi:hypothetical protein